MSKLKECNLSLRKLDKKEICNPLTGRWNEDTPKKRLEFNEKLEAAGYTPMFSGKDLSVETYPVLKSKSVKNTDVPEKRSVKKHKHKSPERRSIRSRSPAQAKSKKSKSKSPQRSPQKSRSPVARSRSVKKVSDDDVDIEEPEEDHYKTLPRYEDIKVLTPEEVTRLILEQTSAQDLLNAIRNKSVGTDSRMYARIKEIEDKFRTNEVLDTDVFDESDIALKHDDSSEIEEEDIYEDMDSDINSEVEEAESESESESEEEEVKPVKKSKSVKKPAETVKKSSETVKKPVKKSETKSPSEERLINKFKKISLEFDEAKSDLQTALRGKDPNVKMFKETRDDLLIEKESLVESLKKYGIDANTLSFGSNSCKLNRSHKKMGKMNSVLGVFSKIVPRRNKLFKSYKKSRGKNNFGRGKNNFGRGKNNFGRGIYGLQNGPAYTGVYPLLPSSSTLVPKTYMGSDVVAPQWSSTANATLENVVRNYPLNA